MEKKERRKEKIFKKSNKLAVMDFFKSCFFFTFRDDIRGRWSCGFPSYLTKRGEPAALYLAYGSKLLLLILKLAVESPPFQREGNNTHPPRVTWTRFTVRTNPTRNPPHVALHHLADKPIWIWAHVRVQLMKIFH